VTAPMAAISGRAAELRRDFDRSFAAAPTVAGAAQEVLIAIRLGAKSFALRLSDIAGVFKDKKIVHVPGADAALLGIAGFRGSITPVYDLQKLLDHSSSQMTRWLVVAAAAPVAFAFEAFEAQLRVSSAAISIQDAHAKHAFTTSFVQTDGVLRPIIELTAVLDAIKT
jgi:chemotaxis signal transduction protein